MSEAARVRRWSGLVITLHWLGAVLILELLVHGWMMLHGGFSAATTFDLFQWHKSLGFVALAVTLARLVARAFSAPPPPLDSPLWERRLAVCVQALLYLVTLVAILSGWLAVSTALLPIPTRFFGLFVVPNIAAPDASLFAATALAHWLAALTIAGLVALHVAGALKHAMVDRDGVFRRILPRWSGGSGA